MSSTGGQGDRTGRNPASSASLFNNVLQAFEDRDLPYSDVVLHLRRLLAAGASPQDLLEVLRRYESIEAFPEYAPAELLSILNEATERAPVPTPTAVPISDTAAATGPAAARTTALASDLAAARSALDSERSKTRELENALAESIASNEAALSKLDRCQAELRTLRAALGAQQNEHRTNVAALEARAQAVETELQADRTRIDARSAESIPGYETTVAIEPVRPGGAPPPATDWRVEPTLGESDAAPNPPFDTRQPGMHAEKALHAEKAPRAGKARHAAKTRRTAGAIARTMGVGAAIVILAMAAWSVVRKVPVVPKPSGATSSAPVPGSVIRDCPTCPPMTVVPAGRFKQGSARAEGVSASFERPLHWVAIRRPFALSTNAVTVGEFGAFVAATGRDMRGCETYDDRWRYRPDRSWQNPGFTQTGSHPVTCVSWDDAQAYGAWLSTTTGHVYRLPSASEWEYAARAGGEAVQPWNADGSGACASANVADQTAAGQYPGWAVFPCDDGYVYTAAVGSFKANSFGLNDMLGNVFQWTADCWHADYAGAPVDGSPRTDGDCSERELRGGSWFTTPEFVRASYRNHFAATYRASTVGIRLVRELTS